MRTQQNRLLSLYVIRGLIINLLVVESCLLYTSLNVLSPNGVANAIVQQFFHHPWHGLHFWDLVRPAFMSMAGAILYISYYYKLQKGISCTEFYTGIKIFVAHKKFIAADFLALGMLYRTHSY